ncbi:hypothetical protein [Apilactobacillus nanyangensis]|uniref:hypothetical protein n=1 Tax=Apilactobacillus nanyangensis TaxID=2799579 RepID=UPI001CEC6EDA|nr:hypothetical protein [Apilactobacillus nanyangensis]
MIILKIGGNMINHLPEDFFDYVAEKKMRVNTLSSSTVVATSSQNVVNLSVNQSKKSMVSESQILK